MTESEAIKEVRFNMSKIGLNNKTAERVSEAKNMAIKALEKQIPKRPIERFNGDEWICECPVCKGITDTPNEVEIECIQYCGWCGQRLDWSDEE